MHRMKLLFALLFISALGSFEAIAEERTWTSTDGKFKVRAELERIEKGIAILKRSDGKTARVPLKKLSEADRQYAQSLSNKATGKDSTSKKSPSADSPSAASAADEPRTKPPSADASNSEESIPDNEGEDEAKEIECVVLRNVPLEIADDQPARFRMQLPRELVRQSLLMAAREELGLQTCDTTVREIAPKKAKGKLLILQISVEVIDEQKVQIKLWEGIDTLIKPLFTKELTVDGDAQRVYESIVSQMGPASRSEFVELLKQLGCKPKSGSAGGNVPEAVKASEAATSDGEATNELENLDRWLFEADIVPQFEGIRRAHRLLRQDPKSADALSILARGYANLCLLTSHYWTGTTHAFHARALLYAERLQHIASDKPETLYAVAYAQAITGRSAVALETLAKVDASAGAFMPLWAKVIEPYARCQSDELFKLGDGEQKLTQITNWLAFQIATCSLEERVFHLAVRRMIDGRLMPFQAMNHMTGDLALQRWAAAEGPVTMQTYLAAYLPLLMKLPASVRKDFNMESIESPFDAIAELIKRLQNTPLDRDRVEPSWRMLGGLLQDQEFHLVEFAINNATNATDSELKPFVEAIMPGVKSHPYAPYLESLIVDTSQDFEGYVKTIERIRVVDPQMHMAPFVQRMRGVKTKKYGDVGEYLRRRVAFDFTFQCLRYRSEYGFATVDSQQMYAKMVERITPHSPYVVRVKLALKMPPEESGVAEMETQAWENAGALDQLGTKYLQQKKIPDALRVLRRSLELAPTTDRAYRLSSVYWTLKDYKKWYETMDWYLKNVDNSGLNHASVHSTLAKGLMVLKRWKDAEPHALAAAEPGPAWGITCAARCYEGMKDFNKANAFYRQAAEFYGDECLFDWYVFCQTHDAGEIEAAREAAERYLAADANPNDQTRVYAEELFEELEGNRQGAMEVVKGYLEQRESLWNSMHLAILAKEQGDKESLEMANAFFRRVAQSEELARSKHRMALAAFALEAFDHDIKQQGKLDKGAAEKLIAEAPDEVTKLDVSYFLGTMFYLNGDTATARTFWQAVTEGGYEYRRPYRPLAAMRLRKTAK